MRKIKRVMSLLLTAVMLLGMFAITSSAQGESANVTIKTDTDTVAAGDVITVTVNVSTNYHATTMRWPVLFSNAFFELVEGSAGATEELAALGGSVSSPAVNDDKSFTSTCTSEEYDSVVFQWMGVSESGWITYNLPDGMDCFTFRLKVKEDVETDTSGVILVPEDSTLFYRQMATDIEGGITFDKIVQCEDLQFGFINATVSCLTPEIFAVEGTETVIDNENKLIRGLDLNVTENIDAYAYAVGCDLVVTPSQDNRIGTGTKVELVLKGEVLETYTVVIAGDINGDCVVDATDYIWLDLAETYSVNLEGASALAAELTGDGSVDVSDKIALDSCLVFAGNIDQTTGTYSAA